MLVNSWDGYLLTSKVSQRNLDEITFLVIWRVQLLGSLDVMCESRVRGRGPDPPPPLKNHKNIGFLSKTKKNNNAPFLLLRGSF